MLKQDLILFTKEKISCEDLILTGIIKCTCPDIEYKSNELEKLKHSLFDDSFFYRKFFLLFIVLN